MDSTIDQPNNFYYQFNSQEILHKVQHMAISMENFKQNFLKRDSFIVGLVKNTIEINSEFQKINDLLSI